jgi:hypothetical protein
MATPVYSTPSGPQSTLNIGSFYGNCCRFLKVGRWHKGSGVENKVVGHANLAHCIKSLSTSHENGVRLNSTVEDY